MKISANTPLLSCPSLQTALPPAKNASKPGAIQTALPQLADQAAKVTFSKEGLAHSHGQLSGGKDLEAIETLKKEGIPMEELPSYCQSINLGISLGGTLQELGQKYAQKYDEILQNHGKGNRVVIKDSQTGELRDATLEEKLAVLDKSFEDALDFAKFTEERRPILIQSLEKRVESFKAIGAVDLADETQYRLENLKSAQKLPEDFRKSMLQIRENFKIAYHMSSKGSAWEGMLEAINRLFEE